jgi:aspartate aminotransferase
MSISKKLEASIAGSSLIRKMFEEGDRRKKLYGPENVFDFSIGNPVFEPPPEVKNSLIELLRSGEKGKHRYMPNAGFPHVRQYVASTLEEETALPFTLNDILMTVGAGGALNVLFKTILNPEDEVIVFKPYFVEYDQYVDNHNGRIVRVETTEAFLFDFTQLEKAITPRTKVVLINSPNNPTGVIYSKEDLARLGELLTLKSKEYGDVITLISDEPYKNILFEGSVPSIFNHYPHSIVGTSYSKDLAIPGERLGYIAISPNHQDRETLQSGAAIALRILGFVNAPALMQRIVPMVKKTTVDIEPYRTNRDILYDHLTKLGFSCVKPAGSFYLFPKCPIEDDMVFIETAQDLNLLLVPGKAFFGPGHFRISFCFETEMIKRSLPVFTELANKFR